MEPTKKPSSAPRSASSFAAGQAVWVVCGEREMEPGIVLRTGCTYSDANDGDGDGNRGASDGVLVQLSVSLMRAIYPPSRLRPVKMGGGEIPPPNPSRRRSPRVGAAASSADSAATTTATTPGAARQRSTVTPSPTAAPSSSEEVSTATAANPAPSSSNDNKRKGFNAAAFETSKPTRTRDSPATKKARVAPKALLSDSASSSSSDSEDNGGRDPAGNDDNEHDDKPFAIESAPTGRATCRRCDQVIPKGALRVSHIPLFRGKPGYRVYRHLDCAVFTEEIESAEDVGGWSRLDKDDLERLRRRVAASREELELENREIQPDELVPLAFDGPLRPPPLGLSASLLPFQVEGASWMHQQEHTEIGGGILADEMGMGKTLQTIATILDHRPKLQHAKPGAKHPPGSPDMEALQREDARWRAATSDWSHEMDMNNVGPKIRPKGGAAGARAGTLVVCPVIALSQWKTEIDKFTDGIAPLTVAVYHGPDRERDVPRDLMRKYDVVLTTYQVLEQDFRKMVSPNKVACPNCGAKYKIDKLRVHLKYFCGESAQRTEAQMRQRRTAPRPGRRNGGGGSDRGGQGGAKKKSFDAPKSAPQTNLKASRGKSGGPATKKVRVRGTDEYDSDTDLSIDDAVASTTLASSTRPSRSAAVQARRRVSASAKELAAAAKRYRLREDDDDEDESSYGSDDQSGSDGSDRSLGDSLFAPKRRNPLSKLATKKKRGRREDSSDDEDEDGEEAKRAVARAREKQRQALDAIARKKMTKGKALAANGKKVTTKGSNNRNGKGKGIHDGKKKFNDESADESGSDSDDDNPLAGIDMDELMGEAMDGARFSVLHSFTWWRVVLDEAHFIKSRSSQTAAAAFSLTSVHRWCLSGTPLQNRVGELYSLIRFLRLDPMAHYFCRQCTCKSIHYRMQQGVCQDCGHRAFSHFAHFNKHVLNPIQRDGYTGDGRRAMFILKTDVLDKCLLRRTKESRAEDMNLPPRIVTVRPVRLHPVEEDFYNALYTQTKSSFDDYVAEGTLLNNYAHIFDLLTKMRQAVNHPYLIVYSSSDKIRQMAAATNQPQSAPVANGSVDCDICHEAPTERVVSSCCGSGFCRSCVIEYLTGAVGDNTPCPSCQRPFTIDLNQATADVETANDGPLAVCSPPSSKVTGNVTIPSLRDLPHVATGSILRRINLAEFATSTKIEVLIQELTEMRKNRPGSKALVFSQFVNMLDLVRWRLHSDPLLADLGLGVRILHGGMDVKSRDAALKEFREDPNCRVLLMSLKAAGVALNLTVASECFLLDLWWNPAAEMQAIDRTHRLGQYRPIRAVRFVAEGTVEERVLQLQEKKRLVFDGTIGRDAGSLKMLTVDDMVQLFS